MGLTAVPPLSWPEPPGKTDKWKWVPNRDPNPGPNADPGHWEDPSRNEWRWHPEDETHHEHWDKKGPKGKSKKIHKRLSRDGKDLGKEAFKPKQLAPWWARLLVEIPPWIIPPPATAEAIADGARTVGVTAAAAALTLATAGTAAPVSAPLLCPI